ncbi:MAG: hypothetical protein AABZ30_13195, partial [Myxococcota bacterium]
SETLGLPWSRGESPFVTIEYSFPGGRIDIVGAFDRRLVLVEVKQGTAGEGAVGQIWTYVSSKEARAALTEALGYHPTELLGVVIAEGFDAAAHRRAEEKDVRLVEFRLDPGSFPFRKAGIPQGTEESSGAPAQRNSRPLTVEDHVRGLQPPDLQALYRSFAGLFLDNTGAGAPSDDAERREWVCPSVKIDHVWIRYKGEGIVCLWARQKTFLVGYTHVDGTWRGIGDIRPHLSPPAGLDAIRDAIRQRMAQIDDQVRADLRGFRWTDLPRGS